jgi:dCTP deaminase
MTILSAQSIDAYVQEGELTIEPYEAFSKTYAGKSYGLTAAGYDIRLGKIRHPERDHAIVESLWLRPGGFILAASFERVVIPDNLQVTVHDKSSWARQGLAAQTTVLEPGWYGHITLELSNHSDKAILISTGMPIAQLVFHQLDRPTDRPYKGKYQGQSDMPTEAIEALSSEGEYRGLGDSDGDDGA